MSSSLLNLNLLSLVSIYLPEQSLHIMGIQECGFRIELGFISWIDFVAAVKFYFMNDRNSQLQGRSKHFVTQSSE